MNDKLKEECGVFGIINEPDAANFIYLGLYALQHRGQEACGIVTLAQENDANGSKSEKRKFYAHKSFGLVVDGISPAHVAATKGDMGIGHNRYSTHGGKIVQNIQPFYCQTSWGPLALAHNGNLTNADLLRKELESQGSIFQSTSDSEVFLHLLAKSSKTDMIERIHDVMSKVHGAYSLVLMTNDTLYAMRDPHGFRPLVLGKREVDGRTSYIAASETCALDLIEADIIREVEPGEVVAMTTASLKCYPAKPAAKKQSAFCSFEPIYFARPDSKVFEDDIYTLRKRMGAVLAEEAPADADVVIAIPDSGVPMAMGYAEVSGLPHELGLVRNHYVGRTFIEPTQAIRDFGVKLKLNPVVGALKGKRVVVIDDSIVRGTTSVKILRMLRRAGAKEIHVRIGSPPITHSCFYGVDTPKRKNLLAAQKTIAEMGEFIGADSLAFLSISGLRKALGPDAAKQYCFACFTGDYQEPIFATISKEPTDR